MLILVSCLEGLHLVQVLLSDHLLLRLDCPNSLVVLRQRRSFAVNLRLELFVFLAPVFQRGPQLLYLRL